MADRGPYTGRGKKGAIAVTRPPQWQCYCYGGWMPNRCLGFSPVTPHPAWAFRAHKRGQLNTHRARAIYAQ